MSITPATYDLLTNQYRVTATTEVAANKVAETNARDVRIDTNLKEEAAANTERDRQFAMEGINHLLCQLEVPGGAFLYKVGDRYTIEGDRFGLAAGKTGIITKVENRTSPDRAILQLELEEV